MQEHLMSSQSRFKSWPYIVQCHISEYYAEHIRIQYHLYCRKSPEILFHHLLLLKCNIPSSFKNLLLSKTLFINFKQSIVQFEKDSNRNLYYYLVTAMAILPKSVLGLSNRPSPIDSVPSIFLIHAHLCHVLLNFVPPSFVGSFSRSFAFRHFKNYVFPQSFFSFRSMCPVQRSL